MSEINDNKDVIEVACDIYDNYSKSQVKEICNILESLSDDMKDSENFKDYNEFYSLFSYIFI